MSDIGKTISTDVAAVEQYIEQEVQAAEAKIVALWNKEKPIVIGEMKTIEEQLAGIAISALVGVLSGIANGTVNSAESFGTLVVTIFQQAEKTGLALLIGDAQSAASQVVSQAQALPGIKAQ